MNLTFKSEHLEYRGLIENFIGSINPNFHVSSESVLEAIMKEIIASQNIRLGPAPSIESQYEMRKVVRYYMEKGLPIPVLVPSGPKKTKSMEIVDVAELSMLNILNCLNNAIKLHYKPGLQIVMRLEDLTGHILEPTEIASMAMYMGSMIDLVNTLDYRFIEPWPESSSGKRVEFNDRVTVLTPLFMEYIDDTQSIAIPENLWGQLESYKRLQHEGWSGLIPKEMRQSYIDKYQKLYPGMSHEECMQLVSKYFACGLARKNINNKGNKPEWEGGFLEIAFMQPYHIIYPTRINYRSIELKHSKKALSFWRAKGFLKISEPNEIRISSCTWSEAAAMDFFEGELVLRNGLSKAVVKCDFILE